MWIYINNLDQVIRLAENLKRAWHLNLFSRTSVKLQTAYHNCSRWYFDCNMWTFKAQITLFVCLFVLTDSPVNPMGSCQAQQFALPHFYWASLVFKMVDQYCAHSFARNWQLPFLNKRKGENDHRKYFMINLQEMLLLTRQGSNRQPLDHQWDAPPTEPPRQATTLYFHLYQKTCSGQIVGDNSVMIFLISP